jgi:hypothetical protein
MLTYLALPTANIKLPYTITWGTEEPKVNQAGFFIVNGKGFNKANKTLSFSYTNLSVEAYAILEAILASAEMETLFTLSIPSRPVYTLTKPSSLSVKEIPVVVNGSWTKAYSVSLKMRITP